MSDNYKNIINLPHHDSDKYKRMSMQNRAAQFAPFAALTGYEDAVIETARLTDERKELDDGLKLMLNEKLNKIKDDLLLNIKIKFTYFIPDNKKDGGKYVTHCNFVKKIDDFEMKVYLSDGTIIPIEEIIEIIEDESL